MASQYRVILKAKDVSGPVSHQIFDADEDLDVRDLNTRATLKVQAKDLSLYRHTLFVDGKEFEILNVVRY